MANASRHRPTASQPWWIRLSRWLWKQRSFIVGNLLLGIALNLVAAWLVSPWGSTITNTPLGSALNHPLVLFGAGLALLTLTGVVWQINRLCGPSEAEGIATRVPSLSDRLALLHILHQDYARRQTDSLHGAPLMPLRLHERADITLSSAQLVFHRTAITEEHPLPPGTSIVQAYDTTADGLLILGEPGTGKTTLLVELALELLTRAQVDSTHPLPVILNLSSWAMHKHPLGVWLIDEMQTVYHLPFRFSRGWLGQDQWLLLLDGLDEVAAPAREACIAAINAYREAHFVPLVVCSRSREYLVQEQRLTLPGATVVQPLQERQVSEYLQQVGRPMTAVRAALRTNPTLRELVTTPLMLDVIIEAYRDKAVKDLSLLGSVEEQQRQIFASYIQRMLERPVTREQFTLQQTWHWLIWLAQQMQQQQLTEFYLERLQPTWLLSQRVQIIYSLLIGLVVWLIVGSFVGIAVGQVFGPLVGLAIGPLVGLAVGVWLAVELGKQNREIKPVEAFTWSWKGFWRGQVFGLVVGPLVGLLVGLVFGPLAGLLVGLIGVLAGGLVGGLSGTQINEDARIQPNQGIQNSGWNAFRAGLVSTLLIVLAFVLAYGSVTVPLTVLLSWLLAGLFGGLVFGGEAYFEHYVLRCILWRSGAMPWRYVRFLEEATERILLQRVGGGYRFIHPLFLDYFASGTMTPSGTGEPPSAQRR